MIINHNIAAMNTFRQLTSNNALTQKSLEKLSSGLRINRAGDDAAGLAISEKMRGQIRGLDQASRNAQDSISLIQTAEGALNETHAILQRMRQLANQAANDSNTEFDRGELQKEINQLTSEIDRIANTTEFNTKKLLNGDIAGLREKIEGKLDYEVNSRAAVTATVATSGGNDDIGTTGTIIITRVSSESGSGAPPNFKVGDPAGLTTTLTIASSGDSIIIGTGSGETTIDLTGLDMMEVGDSITISIRKMEAPKVSVEDALSFQIGANTGQNIYVGINSMRAEDMAIRNAAGEALDISSYENATAALKTIDNALEYVSSERSKLGAVQNRLEHTINNLGTASENLSAAESRIRDVDMAKEIMEFTKMSILSQAAQAMLAQANQMPQGVLQLLR